MTTRAELHRLIDDLPDTELPAVQWFLHYVQSHCKPNLQMDFQQDIFTQSALDDVAGCLVYQGEPKTLEDMEKGLAEGLKNAMCD